MKSALRLCAPLFVFLAVAICSSPAWATTYSHDWCFKWRVTLSDGSYGDYGTGTTWVARGALIAVQHAQTGTQTYYADVGGSDPGCISFTSSVNSGFTVRIHAASRQGGSNNVMVRAFASKAHYDTWKAFKINDNLEEWIWMGVNPACVGTNCTLSLTNTGSTDMVSNLIAVGAWAFRQIDINTNPRLAGTREIFLINEKCGGGNGNGSCQAGDVIWIQNGAGSFPQGWYGTQGASRKFLIGHEIGHWLEEKWIAPSSGQGILSPYGTSQAYAIFDWAPHGIRCDSDAVDGEHALHSAEYQLGAFSEGIAHYFSTLAFNDHSETDGDFKYYKRNDIDGPYNYETVDVEQGTTGGATAYLRSASGCECGSNCSDYGVELDWLRFYWDYRTNGSSESQPSHAQIFDHLNTTYDYYSSTHFGLTDTQTRLQAHVQSTFATRWDDLADINAADINAADPVAD